MLCKKLPLLLNTFQSLGIIFKQISASKYSSLRALQLPNEGIISSLINDDFENRSSNDWANVRKTLLAENISLSTVDYSIINYCSVKKKYNLGIKYWEYLKKEKVKPNLAATRKIFHLLYMYSRENNCSEENQILKLYSDLKNEYEILDATTCDSVAQALSITNKWEEGLKLLDVVKITSVPSTETYSAIAASAFRNSKSEIGWNCLKELVENERTPHSYVYSTYLSQIKKNSVSKDMVKEKVEELFMFFRQYDIMLNENEIFIIKDHCKSIFSSFNITLSDKSGICKSCRKTLQRLNLSKNEFAELRNAFIKNVIIGKDVFFRTSPKEVEKLQNFIKSNVKYNVVIDGLNVAYSAGVKQSPQVFAFLVASVVKHFVQMKKENILVVGRNHMQKWPKKYWGYILENADTFLVDSLSQDDPYLLYCALNSSNDTIIVSKDLMRSHVFKLKTLNNKGLFKRWLMQNQWQLLYVTNEGKVFFKKPFPYMQTVQKDRNNWHIPYESNKTKEIKTTKQNYYPNTTEWACIHI